MGFYRYLRSFDWHLITAAVSLTVFGLISVYSSSIRGNDFFDFQKQVIFLGTGVFLMLVFSFIDYRKIKNDPYFILLLYFICLLLLLGVLALGPEIRGVKSWYKLGPLSFDPIELTRLVLIILLAKYFSSRHIEVYRMRHILISFLYVFIPSSLVFFQPNLGSFLVLIFLWIFTLLISGIRLRQFLFILLVGLLVLGFGWQFMLKDYQKERVIGFLSPDTETLGVGWSQTQAKIAIGSGGVLGKGFSKGTQLQYGFLPEPKTDFIFSAIAEEFGFFGVFILLFLFLFLVWKIIRISLLAQTNFPRLFAAGFAAVLVIQAIVNIGMNLGFLPVIGIALPFVSYGGSGLILGYIGLGLIQNIYKNS